MHQKLTYQLTKQELQHHIKPPVPLSAKKTNTLWKNGAIFRDWVLKLSDPQCSSMQPAP